MKINESLIQDLIYEVRGQKVMLDFDLANIYGYSTKAFNQQVKNNGDRFDDDFMFQTSKEELDSILRSKKLTASWGGRRTLPFAFTEQGIYMLMTVLKGELAIEQSKTLVRLFKQMKDYIVESDRLITANELLRVSRQVYKNQDDIKTIKSRLDVVMDNFIDPSTYRHFLILDGEKLEADEAYSKLYSLPKASLIIIDDYIGSKTLRLLRSVAENISILILSDNVARTPLTQEDLDAFAAETGITISIVPTNNRIHDRYIVVDYGGEGERIYHSGSSSKDAGGKITTIMEIENKKDYHRFIDELIGHVSA